MKTVKALYSRLNNATHFKEKYPEYKPGDGKTHVLFLSACTNESSYYRMIVPALELNRTQTHCAIIGAIHKWDFTKQFDDYDNPIDYRLVQWAHYVVLPVLFSDAEYILSDMRAINSDIEFIMDVDQLYHELPDYHPDAKKLTPALKATFMANFFKVDILSAPNSAILNYYGRMAEQQSIKTELYLERYNNLLSHYTLEEVDQVRHHQNGPVRMGILLDPSQVNDLQTIAPVLTQLLEIFKDRIELIIVGWSEKTASPHGLFTNLKVRYERPVSFFDYHHQLNHLDLDIGLLPFVNNAFNSTGKSLIRYLDFSALMVPVVAAKMIPFDKLITEGENGFIAASEEEWISKLSLLIENQELRRNIGAYAHKLAWERYSYTPRNIQRLRSIFI